MHFHYVDLFGRNSCCRIGSASRQRDAMRFQRFCSTVHGARYPHAANAHSACTIELFQSIFIAQHGSSSAI